MSWKRLPMPDKPDADLNKKVRILVDESLGKAVADYLSESGYNAVYAGDVGLAGKSDEDLAAYAWRERRMLWTHDRDFLDDRIVPQHRNPGIVVLPGAVETSKRWGPAWR
jgi:predicted nuclease of predicted toxin-antitoxin system